MMIPANGLAIHWLLNKTKYFVADTSNSEKPHKAIPIGEERERIIIWMKNCLSESFKSFKIVGIETENVIF